MAENRYSAFDPAQPSGANRYAKFDPAPTATPPDSGSSWLGREVAGAGAAAGESFGDTVLGAQELVGHALHASGFESAGQWLIDDAQSGAKKLKGEAAPYRKAAPTGAFVGDVVGQLPVALGVGEIGMASKIGEAAVSGAASGGLQPTSGKGNFLGEKAKQVGEGAAVGAAGGAIGKGVSSVVAPKLGPDAAALSARGVQLTPGQMVGGVAKRAEDSLTSVPLLGSMIGNAQRASIESFNRAVIDDALSPIGAKLPKSIDVGRDAIEAAQKKVSDAYNSLLPHLKFKADQQFVQDLSGLRSLTAYMPPDQVAQFQKILTDRVALRLSPNGTMDGQTMKQVEAELGAFSAQYRGSSDAAQRQLGDAVRQMQDLLRQNLQRQNPKQAAALQAVNDSYARLVRVEGAASNRAVNGGVFTPGDLLASIKKADKTVRKKSFAGGNALGQDFAESGQKVLPSKVPNSGTPERAMWPMVAGAAIRPEIPIGIGAASLPYTGPALAGLNRLAQPAGPERQTAADILQQLGIYSGSGAAGDVARP